MSDKIMLLGFVFESFMVFIAMAFIVVSTLRNFKRWDNFPMYCMALGMCGWFMGFILMAWKILL